MIFLWVLGMWMILLGGHLCSRGYFDRDEGRSLMGLIIATVGGILTGAACMGL